MNNHFCALFAHHFQRLRTAPRYNPMSTHSDLPSTNPSVRTLLLNACAPLDPTRLEQLNQQLADFCQWNELATEAERQGVGPLLYSHLQCANVSPPRQAKLTLQGIYLRHRHTNQVRSQILAEIWRAFQAAGIPALALKGAALAHLLYAEPGLRPMRDLDILVSKADLFKAREVLTQLDFGGPGPTDGKAPNKHLDTVARHVSGFANSVELHHNLFDSFTPASMTLETVTSTPITFDCAGVPVQTLGPEDMLLHLCEHLAYHASIWEPIRLIWIVDVVRFAEMVVDQVDWTFIAAQRPIVLSMLSLFHHICPLSDALQKASGIKIGSAPQGVGEEFMGWPRYPIAQLRGMSIGQILGNSFLPSEWWLRLHYRLDSVQSLFWYRWFFHPLYVLGPFYLVEKIRLFWHLKLKPLGET